MKSFCHYFVGTRYARAYLTTKIGIVCEITILFTDFLLLKNKVFTAMTDKRTLRRAIRAEIAKLTTDEKMALSAQIFSKLDSCDKIHNASVVAIFISLEDEPQTATFIEQLSGKNKRVVVPRIEGEEMNFYDISDGVKTGSFGIMEPISEHPIEPSEIDVMIVPGVVFTPDGMRCGRGKGFYDRYLSREGFRAYTIGVCYPCQIVESIPREEHDKKLDCTLSI